MKLKKVAFTASVLSIVFLSSCGPRELKLGFNVKKGEKYKVVQAVDQNITQEISGQKANIDQSISTGYTFAVTNIDKTNTATVRVTYDTISIKSTGDGQTLEYDSTKNNQESNPLGKAYSTILGKSFTLKIDNAGNIVSVEGVNSLLNSMIKNLEIPDEALKASITETLRQSFGDEAIRDTLSQMTDVYPDKPVKVGESWQNKQTSNVGFPITVNNKWTLRDDRGGILTADVVSKLSTDSPSTPVEMMRMRVKYNFQGGQKGTIKINKSTGIIESGVYTQNARGTMEFEANQLIPQGLKVPMTIVSKVVFNVKKQ